MLIESPSAYGIHMLNSIRIGTLLIFTGINLRFITENILSALIFLNILQTENPGLRYDIHAPSIPDICGDVVMIIIFTAAYLFITSLSVKRIMNDVPSHFPKDFENKYLEVIKQLKDYMRTAGAVSILHRVHLESLKEIKNYIRWTKGIFSICIVSLSLYLFSKYVLSIGLEIFPFENTCISFILNFLNDVLRLCSCFVFVYIYCSYLSTSKIINGIFYVFFFVRNLFAMNIMRFIGNYDLHVVAPFLDILTPLILVYSVIFVINNYKTILLYRIVGIHTKTSP